MGYSQIPVAKSAFGALGKKSIGHIGNMEKLQLRISLFNLHANITWPALKQTFLNTG
eukprot:CAMPEP_0179012062 /NCGR_PEP_ID=MMETSP0796-20121207/998_1 /TAXON_ID=73915 /ORGANISM="Pyrodinium bahamense, Strain pbaha01" /LENGTH=56 /DNA_ID=CAMNT_0020707485 /DNA_START=419 /DNA_END=589 /DNA_ORIENTATION=-